MKKNLMSRLLACVIAIVIAVCLIPMNLWETDAATKTERIGDLYYNGHRYQLVLNNEGYDFAEAQKYCEDLGGHLATISSEGENKALYDFIHSLGYQNAYFGYTDEDNEGVWEWVTGEQSSYTNWSDGEPNNESSNEHYAMFYYKSPEYTWNDGGWNTVNAGIAETSFLCEWEVEVETTLKNPVITNNGDGASTTTWDCIYFGSYPQSSDGNGGFVTEPIKWRVLSVDGDDAFLLADQNLDCQPYNEEFTDVTWETCTLRSWLNDEFMDIAFTAMEQTAIKRTTVVNDDNPECGTEGGNGTQDRVYLLSIDEVTNTSYGFDGNFNLSETREAKNTAYAIELGAWTSAIDEWHGNGWWWLRSPGDYSRNVVSVYDHGVVDNVGINVDFSNYAVRPALHLDLSSDVWRYAGTVSSDGTVSYGHPVVDMMLRNSDTLRPMSEFEDPNQLIQDYLSLEEQAKMVVTLTGEEILSDLMWQEAYRRTLTKLSDGEPVLELASDINFVQSINSQLADMISEALKKQSISLGASALSAVTAGLEDSVQSALGDVYILETIYENTDDENLKEACEQLMHKSLEELYKQVIKEVGAQVPELTETAIKLAGEYFTTDVLSKTSKFMTGLGYTCQALGYVGNVLFVRDIVVGVNGWAEMTEAYQDVVAYSYIKIALCNAFQEEAVSLVSTENWMDNEERLANLGVIYQYIEDATKLSYADMKTMLGKDYNAILASDKYLQKRACQVQNLDMETYRSSDAQYMMPRCTKKITLKKGKKQKIVLKNVRYGVKRKFEVVSGKKYISVNKNGRVKGKKKGVGTVKVTIYQNGGKEYIKICNVKVLPKNR